MNFHLFYIRYMPHPPAPPLTPSPQNMAKKSISLPVLYESWPRVRDDLKAIADKTATGLDALKQLLEKNDGDNVTLSQLGQVTADSGEHFCDVQLPWLASKALQVEELFKQSEHKIQVRKKTKVT